MSQIPAATLPINYRVKPILTYCGLTIVLSNPSRFDRADLLSSTGGYLFCQELLQPEFNRMQCDIRLKDNREPLLPNTKCVLLLGESAAKLWLRNEDNSLGEIRGAPYLIDEIPHIASYLPQDACDVVKEHELENNPYLQSQKRVEDDTNEDEEVDEKRRHGKTKRKNYRFWLGQDVKKAKSILKYGGIPPAPFVDNYRVYPSSSDILRYLSRKDEVLFIDIETDKHWNILCFSFSFSYGPIYCVPCLLHDYTWAYSSLPQIYKALLLALNRNIVVAHNGSGFDYLVFTHKYRIPIGRRLEDTMLMLHRAFPEVEKSLGHGTSLCTNEPFHKDESNFAYNSPQVCKQLWTYCGKDVYTMMLIYRWLKNYAKTQPGLTESMQQANDSIRPYLITSLQGIAYRESMLRQTMADNDRKMTQHLRMVDILIGRDFAKSLRKKSKSGLCGSNTQCVSYFHDFLNYPIVGYGKPSKQDGKRRPSLQKKNLLKLRLKVENPVIDITMAYRECAKESGSLKFIPLKNYASRTN